MTGPGVIGNRKDDHVRYAVDQHRHGAGSNDFDSVAFVHHALAGIDRAQVNLAIEIAGRRWATPLYINAMTGGSDRTGVINRELAIAAAATGLPIASGSMSAYLCDATVADTYRVLRTENPHGFVMANVNANTTGDQARCAVDLLEANALQIHLNAVQEIVMGGVAGVFLTILLDQGTETLIATIGGWLDQLTSIMTVLGAVTPHALTGCDLLLTGAVETYCRATGIDPYGYAHRSLSPAANATGSAGPPTPPAPPEQRGAATRKW
ncbi:hypothetical protein [Nocardia terpenica]|uniref:hypothetical protein n=1 Tax=Nocardia terpenica TaxID=455432 RepID=UPI001EEB333D|nr:hypothetical protein [Nocardia terpenica]